MTGQEVVETIRAMRKRWGMYAITREGFLMQITTMLRIVYGFDGLTIQKLEIKLAKMPLDLTERIDVDFAERACDEALRLIFSPLK